MESVGTLTRRASFGAIEDELPFNLDDLGRAVPSTIKTLTWFNFITTAHERVAKFLGMRRPAHDYAELCRDLAPHGLFGMHYRHPVRRFFIHWAKSVAFNNLVLLMILGNCATLAMSSNEPGWGGSVTSYGIQIVDYIFNAVFLLEMIVKIVAMGFFASKLTYLRDGWNVLDFVVVTLSVVGWIPGVSTGKGTTAMRTIRALRPLRTITRVPGLRALVEALIASMPMMLDVFVLLSFLFTLFAIIGVELLNEKMGHACWQVTNVGNGTALPATPVWGNVDGYPWPGPYPTACSGPLVSVYPERPATTGLECLEGWWCGPYVNNNYGAANFDNIGVALLSVLYALTTSFWTEVMYQAMDALSPTVWIFFCSMVIALSWFAANLAVAVLYVQFANKERSAGVQNEARPGARAPEHAGPPADGRHAERLALSVPSDPFRPPCRPPSPPGLLSLSPLGAEHRRGDGGVGAQDSLQGPVGPLPPLPAPEGRGALLVLQPHRGLHRHQHDPARQLLLRHARGRPIRPRDFQRHFDGLLHAGARGEAHCPGTLLLRARPHEPVRRAGGDFRSPRNHS